VETAGTVAGVVDGADWCQQFFDAHRPDAIRILDFPHSAQRLSEVAAAVRVQGAVLGYLAPRRGQVRYAAFRAQGLPIGSGIVESANKTVVETRMKGAGRRWAEDHVNPLLALRGALGSGRWEEAWGEIVTARRARHAPSVQGTRAPVPGLAASAASVAAPASARPAPPSPAIPRSGPKTIVNGRPTARHPWKRYPAVPLAPAKL
jgi:hypothetical protein